MSVTVEIFSIRKASQGNCGEVKRVHTHFILNTQHGILITPFHSHQAQICKWQYHTSTPSHVGTVFANHSFTQLPSDPQPLNVVSCFFSFASSFWTLTLPLLHPFQTMMKMKMRMRLKKTKNYQIHCLMNHQLKMKMMKRSYCYCCCCCCYCCQSLSLMNCCHYWNFLHLTCNSNKERQTSMNVLFTLTTVN